MSAPTRYVGDVDNAIHALLREVIMDTEKPTADKLAAAFLNLRDAYYALKKENEEKEAELKVQMEMLQAEMNRICQEQNATSIKTTSGTIVRSVSTKYYTTDWDSLYQFINTHQAPYLLEKRISNGAMRDFLEDNPDVFPMGMNTDRAYSVTVRRPSKKI
jgi:hypothetical protein